MRAEGNSEQTVFGCGFVVVVMVLSMLYQTHSCFDMCYECAFRVSTMISEVCSQMTIYADQSSAIMILKK